MPAISRFVINAAREFLGLGNNQVRAICLLAAVYAAAVRQLHGLEWKHVLDEAGDVVGAILRSEAPTFGERFFLGLYYTERGELEEAMVHFQRADADTDSNFTACFYLALAAQQDTPIDPEYLESLKRRVDQRLIQLSVSFYLSLQDGVDQALDFLGEPRSDIEASWQVALLCSSGRWPEARGVARKSRGLRSHPGEESATFAVWLAATAEDWDDSKLLESIENAAAGSRFDLAWGSLFLGYRCLGRQDISAARRHFQAVVDQRQIQSAPHMLARALLQRLDTESWPLPAE